MFFKKKILTNNFNTHLNGKNLLSRSVYNSIPKAVKKKEH